MDRAREDSLQAENDRLRARVRELEDALYGDIGVPIAFGLTNQEARVFGVLVKRVLASREAIMAALYGDRPTDAADPKIVDVLICKLRKKLARFGVEVLTAWGRGWYLADDARHELMTVMGVQP